jgi:hypothetical protein
VARGGPENPLGDDELLAKYRAITAPVLGRRRGALIESGVAGLADGSTDLPRFLADLLGSTPEEATNGE